MCDDPLLHCQFWKLCTLLRLYTPNDYLLQICKFHHFLSVTIWISWLIFLFFSPRYTCIRCQTTFNDSTRLHNHMTQCHMAALPPTSSTASIQQQFTSVRSPQSSPARMPPSSIASAGSPLPQISSVTSLRLMPGGMNMPSPSSPSPSHLQQQPVPTSIFQSPVRSRNPSASSPAASPRGSPHGASPRVSVALETIKVLIWWNRSQLSNTTYEWRLDQLSHYCYPL